MSSTGPIRKPLKAQPKNVARRSQAERDALERAEAERKRARAEAAAADAAAEASSRRAEYGLPANDHRQNKWRGRDVYRSGRGGRGGFMGPSGYGVTGGYPPALQPEPPQSRNSNNGSNAGALGRRAGPSTARGRPSSSSIKREPALKQSFDEDIAMLGIPSLKRDPEDLGYISSDPGEAEVGPQVNVDYINLLHDDEQQEIASDASREITRQLTSATPAQRRRRYGGGEPVRLQRKEHTDRVVNINTEASSAATAASRKKTEEHIKAGRSDSFDEGLTSVTKRAKARGRDVEVLGDRRRWKGVWNDDDDVQEFNIKQEPTDERMTLEVNSPLTDVEIQTSSGNVEAGAPRTISGQSLGRQEFDAKTHVRHKLRNKGRDKVRPSIYQTAEEIREWEKRQEELATIQQELGRIHISKNGHPVETLPIEEGDVADKRQDAVYLFQLPAVLPDLVEPTIKKEPSSPPVIRHSKPPPSTIQPSSEVVPTKIEDEDFGGDLDKKHSPPTLVPGRAGRLRIHQSGRSTITWGGTNMEMKMGVSPYFLQTAVLTRMHSHTSDDATATIGESFGGQAVSFGQIRGKLVVLPAWTDILGERGLA